MRIPAGAQNKMAVPSLVIVTPCGERYGVTHIQFPERGYPSGGSSFAYPAECFHEPETPTETLWAQQYLTAKRVVDLKAELLEAEADVEAVKRWAALRVRLA